MFAGNGTAYNRPRELQSIDAMKAFQQQVQDAAGCCEAIEQKDFYGAHIVLKDGLKSLNSSVIAISDFSVDHNDQRFFQAKCMNGTVIIAFCGTDCKACQDLVHSSAEVRARYHAF